jgi:ATP-dependent Lhr-like helicase
MPYNLLSEPIRKYVRDKRWEALRPIQAAAIEKILTTDHNYILASRTASGKTEAAFLPVLSKTDFNKPGIQVLYISPLIALINDQFARVEELCKYLDISVTKWHGEANRTLKERIIKHPNGVVLITPESLEAMFVNKPHNVKQLFHDLKFVILDEIHSFIGNDRGTQLKSILHRLKEINTRSFNIIGLSATIGDYKEAKKFTGDEANTKVLLDKTAKEINAVFRFFQQEGEELPLDLLKDLYTETKDNKVLIFPNSRGRAEEVAVKLKKVSDRVKGHGNYFSHHSSVDKEVREYVEHFAKNNKRNNFCISCTSTLELGIDIGTVDEVVQIDSAHSIASLIQRVGRSGRRDGETSNLFLYATNPWSLLQAIACWTLYKEGFIEPPLVNDKPYDILLHQALSITKGHSGIDINILVDRLKNNSAFSCIDQSEIQEIVNHLIKIDFLEKIQTEVIIGIEGEKVVNGRDFYTVFKTEENFKVIHKSHVVGEVPFSPQIIEDENILLAARIWKIKFIDEKSKKIEVIPALDGKKPMFLGSGVSVYPKVRQKMLDILYSQEKFEFLDQSSSEALNELRGFFSAFNISNTQIERPVDSHEEKAIFYTFSGTRINRTISFLLTIGGLKNYLEDQKTSSIELDVTYDDFLNKWNKQISQNIDVDFHLTQLLEEKPAILEFSKWGYLLPIKYQIQLLKQKYFDFQALDSIRSIKFIANI